MPGKEHTDQFAFPLTAESFEELFRANYSRLCLFANHFINDFDTAEDIVKDLFIAVWNKRNTIRFTGSASAYMHTALRHKCYNHLRDHKQIWSLADHESQQVDLHEGEQAREEEERAIMAAETFQRVHELLQQLPSKCRTVAQLALLHSQRRTSLISGFIQHRLTEDERMELDDWLSESEENVQLFEKLTDEKNIYRANQWLQRLDVDAAFADVRSNITDQRNLSVI